MTDYVLYDEAGIEERTGVRPELYPFLASLRGDPSDNLPGVPGVGEKTAAKLVNAYGDADTLFAHLDEQTPRLRASLAEHESQVRLNLQMTPLIRDVPLSFEPDDLTLGRSDREEMRSLFDLLEIRGPRDRIFKQLDRLEPLARSGLPGAHDDPGGPRRATATVLEVPARPVEIVLLDAVETACAWLKELASSSGPVAVEAVWAARAGRSRSKDSLSRRSRNRKSLPIQLRSPRTGLLDRPPARRRLAGRQNRWRSRRWPRRCRSCSERDRTDPRRIVAHRS